MKNVNSVNNTLKDQLSRRFEYLRISVTDRCNFRCSYCMPSDIFNKDYKYIPHDRILSYEEIIGICKLLKKVGLKKIRITGGEPLLRKNIDKLIYKLKTEVMIDYISITTNGSLLTKEKIYQLKLSGLDSITLSLDSLNQSKIEKINGTKININLAQTLGNIENSCYTRIFPKSHFPTRAVFVSLLSHFRLQLWCQSLDLVVLRRLVAEVRLETLL